MTEERAKPMAKLVVGGQEFELPVITDSFGNLAVDITGLYKRAKIMTLDRGFTSTASCESGITYIDGDNGLLLYRGYPIEQLAEKGCYVETAYLLLKGELPTREDLATFEEDLFFTDTGELRGFLDEQLIEITKRHRRDTHPMQLIGSTVAALDSFHRDIDFASQDGRDEIALNLVAKVPTITALSFRYVQGKPIVYPREDLSYAGNFMRMCFARTDGTAYEINPVVERAMDRIFMLHADHEQNASTSTVRLAGSTGVAPHAAIATGVAALWGPRHGGANEAVLKMLEEIGTVENIPDFLDCVKDPQNSTRLMGFGHRVYKSYDPRAKIMRETCHEVLGELGIKDPLLNIAMDLEKRALDDPYFINHNLYPNVDFYSGIVLRALKFPPKMFTALFALARTAGWVAQWKEMVEGDSVPIGRPRQHYVGYRHRNYVPLDMRGTKGPKHICLEASFVAP